MNEEFAIALQQAIDSTILTQVEEYGYCHYYDEFTRNYGFKITIAIYELEGKTYFVKYVDDVCTMFKDITPLPSDKKEEVCQNIK